MSEDIRYYKGIIECEIVGGMHNKALIRYRESGIVGMKDLRKTVFPGELDIVPIRLCWRKERNE